jgi:hypothetical protein
MVLLDAALHLVRRGSFILNLPLHHSNTSSARPDKGSGAVLPSALVVFRFRKSCHVAESPATYADAEGLLSWRQSSRSNRRHQ